MQRTISRFFFATTQATGASPTKRLRGPQLEAAAGIILGGTLSCLIGSGNTGDPWCWTADRSRTIIATLAGVGVGAVAGGVTGSIIGMRMLAFEAIQYQAEMGGGNILISVLTGTTTERDRVKAIFDNAGSVTAAEAVVDHAYSRPSGAVGAAMSPTAIHARGDA